MPVENASPVLWPPPLSDASHCVDALEVLASMHISEHQVAFIGTLTGPPGCGKSTALRCCAGRLVSVSKRTASSYCSVAPLLAQNLQLSEISTLQSVLCAKPSPRTSFRTQLARAVLPWVKPAAGSAKPGQAAASSSALHINSPMSPSDTAHQGLLLVLEELPALLAGIASPLAELQRLLTALRSNQWAGPVLLAATCCSASALPGDWRSISPVVLHMTPPDEEQRRAVFRHHFTTTLALSDEAEAVGGASAQLAVATAAFCAADLAFVLQGGGGASAGEGSPGEKLQQLTKSVLNTALSHVPTAIRQLQHSGIPCRPVPPSAEVTLDSIGGAADAKAALAEALVWPRQHPQLLQDAGITPARGILLYGPPGTGKTLLAKAAAGTLGVPFLPVGVADIMRPQVGDSQKLIAQVFSLARAASPCVLFLDEVQALFSSRRGGEGGGHASAVQQMEHQLTTQLLTEMNALSELPGVGVVVVAATNAPAALDSALLRPGRLGRCIHVGLPDATARQDILHSLLQGVDVDAAVDLDVIAERCSGFTGADLSGVVQVARGLALREVLPPAAEGDPLGLQGTLEGFLEESLVCQEHLLSATLRVVPSVSAATVKAMAEWR